MQARAHTAMFCRKLMSRATHSACMCTIVTGKHLSQCKESRTNLRIPAFAIHSALDLYYRALLIACQKQIQAIQLSKQDQEYFPAVLAVAKAHSSILEAGICAVSEMPCSLQYQAKHNKLAPQLSFVLWLSEASWTYRRELALEIPTMLMIVQHCDKPNNVSQCHKQSEASIQGWRGEGRMKISGRGWWG